MAGIRNYNDLPESDNGPGVFIIELEERNFIKTENGMDVKALLSKDYRIDKNHAANKKALGEIHQHCKDVYDAFEDIDIKNWNVTVCKKFCKITLD